jgi:hypothetical protein
MSDSPLILPEGEYPQMVAGAAYWIGQTFGEELGTYIHNVYKADGQHQWFAELKQYRLSNGQPFPFDDYKDPRFILGEQLKPGSAFPEIIPNWTPTWKNTAQIVRKKLQSWGHHRASPSILNLKGLADSVGFLVSGYEMEDSVRALIVRCNAILNNTYVPATVPTVLDVPIGTLPIVEVVEQYRDRPPVGSRWTTVLPTRKLKLSHSTEDLTESGRSVKSQLGFDADSILKKWFAYFPQGGEVFVDDDSGAVVAFKKGDAHLIGWFGKEPDYGEDVIRGFFIDKEYVFTGDDVQALPDLISLRASQALDTAGLVSKLSKDLMAGTRILITDYGDIAYEKDEDSFVKVATVNVSNWFEGHLPS